MPSVAKAKSKAGLEAFARHWLAARSYLVKTGDPSALLGLSTSACDWCTGIAKVFADTYRAGGHYSGGLDAAVMAVMLSGLSGANSGYIQFRAEIPAYTKIARGWCFTRVQEVRRTRLHAERGLPQWPVGGQEGELAHRSGGVLRRPTLIALCGLAVLAATGCTENPPASTLPPPSTTPTSTLNATQTQKPDVPVMPVAAKAKTKAGVEAFARYWIATLDFLVKTGDARPLQAASSTNCDWCNQLIKAYGDIYRAGGHLSGELDSRITIVHLVRLTDTNRGYVEFRVVAPAHTEVPSKGATPEQNKEAVLDFTLKETFSDRQWKISDAVWTTVESG